MIRRLNRLPRALAHTAGRLPSHIVQGRFLSLSITTGAEVNAPRVSCVVSKKVLAKAHDRNLLRRRLRALAADVLKKGAPASVIFIRAKKSAGSASVASLREDVEGLFRRIG